MKHTYLITTLLSLSLMTSGCLIINVQTDGQGKHKHVEHEEGEEKEHGKKHHEKEEGEEREEKEEGEKKGGHESQEKLKAEAKVSEEQARKIALEKVPNGTIKEGELERENGHLQWSFDVSTPGTKDITEVNIDAISGKVLAVDKESAADEKAEAEKEEKEKK
jgi:uncharacterized membrane protein YkoI